MRQNRTMKFLLSSLLLLLTLNTVNAFASDDEVISALMEENNFQLLAKTMKEKSLGLVLMLHAEDCPYCELMEDEILSPMVKSEEYDKKVLIRKLQIDDTRSIVNFSGAIVDPSYFSDKFNAYITPTLVFLDYQGKERVTQMVGINTVEMFGGYLDIEIDKLAKELQAEESNNKKTTQID